MYKSARNGLDLIVWTAIVMLKVHITTLQTTRRYSNIAKLMSISKL